MGHELPRRPRPRDRRGVALLDTDLLPHDGLANSVAAAPISQMAPARTPSPIKRHNLWIAQFTPRDRLVQATIIVVLFVGAVLSVSRGAGLHGGRTLGMVAFMAFTLLLLACLVAFSRWGGRVGHRGWRKP